MSDLRIEAGLDALWWFLGALAAVGILVYLVLLAGLLLDSVRKRGCQR